MNQEITTPHQPNFLQKIIKYFLQGLLVLSPITVTVWALYSLFQYVDNILPTLVYRIFPDWVQQSENGHQQKIPGIGILVVLVLVVIVGWFSNWFIIKRLLKLLDSLLESTPGVRLIYGLVKDFLEAFAGNKKKFDHPVLVNVDEPGIWRIGFITQPDCSFLKLPTHLAVYVPHSYAISGVVYIVPTERIKKIESLTSSQAMKFTVSGGIASVENKPSEKTL